MDQEYIDIYAELDEPNLVEQFEKLQDQNNQLIRQVNFLEVDNKRLTVEITNVKHLVETLKMNISKLFNTARNELQRKDKLIASLREQVELCNNKRQNRWSSSGNVKMNYNVTHQLVPPVNEVNNWSDQMKIRQNVSSSPVREQMVQLDNKISCKEMIEIDSYVSRHDEYKDYSKTDTKSEKVEHGRNSEKLKYNSRDGRDRYTRDDRDRSTRGERDRYLRDERDRFSRDKRKTCRNRNDYRSGRSRSRRRHSRDYDESHFRRGSRDRSHEEKYRHRSNERHDIKEEYVVNNYIEQKYDEPTSREPSFSDISEDQLIIKPNDELVTEIHKEIDQNLYNKNVSDMFAIKINKMEANASTISNEGPAKKEYEREKLLIDKQQENPNCIDEKSAHAQTSDTLMVDKQREKTTLPNVQVPSAIVKAETWSSYKIPHKSKQEIIQLDRTVDDQIPKDPRQETKKKSFHSSQYFPSYPKLHVIDNFNDRPQVPEPLKASDLMSKDENDLIRMKTEIMQSLNSEQAQEKEKKETKSTKSRKKRKLSASGQDIEQLAEQQIVDEDPKLKTISKKVHVIANTLISAKKVDSKNEAKGKDGKRLNDEINLPTDVEDISIQKNVVGGRPLNEQNEVIAAEEKSDTNNSNTALNAISTDEAMNGNISETLHEINGTDATVKESQRSAANHIESTQDLLHSFGTQEEPLQTGATEGNNSLILSQEAIDMWKKAFNTSHVCNNESQIGAISSQSSSSCNCSLATSSSLSSSTTNISNILDSSHDTHKMNEESTSTQYSSTVSPRNGRRRRCIVRLNN